ncbi:MAG: CBS domain-containing protein [Acidobacteria bacterium]|nr:CBS domain-containing protein [Acidobacteriota bacterium]
MESEPTRRPSAARAPGTIGGFRVFGIPIRFHFTFLFLAVFLVSLGIGNTTSIATAAIYIAGLFLSLLLHELAHAAAARWFRIDTVEVVIFPTGGLARMARQPRAREEVWISLAGPLINATIGLTLMLVFHPGISLLDGRALIGPHLLQPTDQNLFHRLAAANFLLAAFNILPGFPMDGGRVLRGILARKKPPEEATQIAAATGRMLALGAGLYGLLSMHFFLVFIAFFIYLGASQESAAATGRVLLQGVPVRAAMLTDFRTLSHGATLQDAADLLIATAQQDFPVLHGDRVEGLLVRGDLLRALAVQGPDNYVAGIMNRDFVALTPDTPLTEALSLLPSPGHCALVLEGGRLAGMLTSENLAEFLILRRFSLSHSASAAGR